VKAFDLVLPEVDRISNPYRRIHALTNAGRANAFAGRADEGVENLLKALAQAREFRLPTLEGYAALELGYLYWYRADYLQGKAFFAQAVRIARAEQSEGLAVTLQSAPMSLIGCGVMTGVGAVLYSAKVQHGDSVAVFGCGGVGDSVIQGAKIAGATTIIAVDIDPQKLEWAKDFGATHTVNASEGDPVAEIKRLTGGHGVNHSFEAVGISQTLEQALFCRDLAGNCVLIGVPGPGPRLNIDIQQFFDLGGSLTVSWYGNCIPARDFPTLAAWYQQGTLDLDRLVSRKITLEETNEAFEAMKRGETLRSVIVFD
jgi:S-(hydroxymethyl)mycothiol dehydrogenase